MADQAALLETRAISKSYSGIKVLKAIDFRLFPGQIQALMGGNGAGKSTLMKIIAGVLEPDSGEILLANRVFHRLKPEQAHASGIYMVAQEPMLFADLTVQENILFRLPDKRNQVARLQEKLRQLGCKFNLQASASTLDVAGQQMVEILRGLMRNVRVLILDEPASSLTLAETRHLFRQIRGLQAAGVGIIFISHKLPEIRSLASHISVMRDGAIVLQGKVSAIKDSALIAAMTPDQRHLPFTETATCALKLPESPAVPRSQQPLLRVENLTGEGFTGINFSLHAGEIVGLAGLAGAGRTELAETLYGLRPVFSGAVWLEDREITHYGVKQRLRNGLVYLPEDRQSTGLFPDASVCRNMLVLNEIGFWQRCKREEAVAERYRRALAIKIQQLRQPVRTLSGGNQQKVLLARCLQARPHLLIVDEPTRGVDVSARADIYRLLKSVAAQQVGVLLISSDVDEFPALADRVLVMHQGTLTGELSGENLAAHHMMSLALGGKNNENVVSES